VENFISGNNSVEVGLTQKADRRNVFRIKRFKNDHGFQVYTLENTAEGRKIFIPRFIFGRFRACVRSLFKDEKCKKQAEPFEQVAAFLNREYFYFKSSSTDLEHLIIQDIEEREGSSGYITVSRRSLYALDKLLYDNKLQHPNDVLQEIISYHKLFQFSFVKGSKSITSGLALRKDVLQTTERYIPGLARQVLLDSDSKNINKNVSVKPVENKSGSKLKDSNLYRPKLGERFNEKDIKVDYDEVFSDTKISPRLVEETADSQDEKNSKGKSLVSKFHIPLAANEIKLFDSGKFYFELSAAEASEFREKFISDRACDFYMGFEIIDAIFPFNRSIRTFKFPLYYTKVDIRESGRGVYLEIRDDGLFYLNHLALAQLVEKFSEATANVDPVDKFFKTLLAQDISVDRLNDRIRLSRYLPVKESIFDRTREIILGYQGENGKGGILSDLKVKGIECDLQNVFLYRAPKILNPVDQALEADLDRIIEIAHQSVKRFYNSLLGKFLTPEQQGEVVEDKKNNDHSITWMPGSLPQSTRSLIDKLNQHELVLLEGPPGTGKTYTIMNLLIHCINSKQRILIVSDQSAAIEALVEKLQEYLIGADRGTPAERKWKELLFSAIKVVDEVETGDQTLHNLVSKLTEKFNVTDPGPGAEIKGENLDSKIRELGRKIEKLKTQIAEKMQGFMGDEAGFDHRVPEKNRADRFIPGLLEFLDLLQGKESKSKKIIDGFVKNRFSLISGGMEECFNFFKIPVKNINSEIKTLKNDEEILSFIIEKKPLSVEEFHKITREHPRHEIIRYLESVILCKATAQGSFFSKLIIKFRLLFIPPLQVSAKILLKTVTDQIALLNMSEKWSSDLLSLLRDLHETIRIGEEPCHSLNLYRSIESQLGTVVSPAHVKGSSIQGCLEEIDDLFKQQDKIVRARLVESFREIVRSATNSKNTGGTNNITSIIALAENLQQFNSIGESGPVFDELREKLFETFPVWIVRKQMVPFLLPCIEQSFDLVVVDEATQCRVDDAMSLMFRARKILVVGDDKQTVLQKSSVIDDYLFNDHELDEHLRSTQARGFKGGGSHIFALVKAIKQASVMLDEHYRCPADIIEFSNKYVYDSGLNVMQWHLPEHPPSVIVNYSEKTKKSSRKATSGKFKGIETEMLDRFVEFMLKTIKGIEKSRGKKINVETDVAICYFLLKNEPYVKMLKEKFLRKLNRGESILDGAGAALQGKERDYIFYLWDITRYNLGAFKQGDDADKRKGELNVLMSRPKKMAFHYIHRNFDQLEHTRTHITQYLWRVYSQHERTVSQPESNGEPLNDTLLGALLKFTIDNSSNRGIADVKHNIREEYIDFRENIAVGDTGRVVDLIAFPRTDFSAVDGCKTDSAMAKATAVIGLVDLSGFGIEKNTGQSIVDYYFQLKRVSPGIDPVFIFPHELIDANGQSFRSLVYKLEQLDIVRSTG